MILFRFSAVALAVACILLIPSLVFIHSSYAVHILLHSNFRMFPRYLPTSISLNGQSFGLGILHGFARNSPLSFQAPTRQFKIPSIGPSFSLGSIFGTQGSGDAPAPGLDNVWDPKLWNPTSAYFDSVPSTKKCNSIEV